MSDGTHQQLPCSLPPLTCCFSGLSLSVSSLSTSISSGRYFPLVCTTIINDVSAYSDLTTKLKYNSPTRLGEFSSLNPSSIVKAVSTFQYHRTEIQLTGHRLLQLL